MEETIKVWAPAALAELQALVLSFCRFARDSHLSTRATVTLEAFWTRSFEDLAPETS